MQFTGKKDKGGNPTIIHPILGECSYIDLRSNEDIAAEQMGASLISLGKDVDLLVDELVVIGKGLGYLKPCREDYEGEEKVYDAPYPTFDPNEFDSRNHHVRTRKIGEALDKAGGFRLMQVVAARIRELVPEQARALEFAWGDIGQWLP